MTASAPEYKPNFAGGGSYIIPKKCLVHACAMSPWGFAWLKRLLPMSRRDQGRLAQLDQVRADLATIADRVRGIASWHDAHAHSIWKAARAKRAAMTGTHSANAIQIRLMLGQAADAAVTSKRTAAALDNAVEALERLAAGLRNGKR